MKTKALEVIEAYESHWEEEEYMDTGEVIQLLTLLKESSDRLEFKDKIVKVAGEGISISQYDETGEDVINETYFTWDELFGGEE